MLRRFLFWRAIMPGEYVSEAREGMDNIADALRTLAGSICLLAAGQHTKSVPDQRDQGEAFYVYAVTRFAELTRKLDNERRDQLNAFIDGMCKKAKK